MYLIPYGTVLKLRDLGLKEKKEYISERIVPHIILRGSPYAIIDNGLVNGKHWRFLAGPWPHISFNFSEKDLPITLFITDSLVECRNASKQYIRCGSIEEGNLLISVFHAFYPGNYGEIHVEDKRREIKLLLLERTKANLLQKLEQIKAELTNIQTQLTTLDDMPENREQYYNERAGEMP